MHARRWIALVEGMGGLADLVEPAAQVKQDFAGVTGADLPREVKLVPFASKSQATKAMAL